MTAIMPIEHVGPAVGGLILRRLQSGYETSSLGRGRARIHGCSGQRRRRQARHGRHGRFIRSTAIWAAPISRRSTARPSSARAAASTRSASTIRPIRAATRAPATSRSGSARATRRSRRSTTAASSSIRDASFTQVFNGNLPAVAGGALTLNLSTAFNYSASQNLVLIIRNTDLSGDGNLFLDYDNNSTALHEQPFLGL